MAADLVARVRAEIEGRLAELRPAVDEYERLLGAVDALEASDDARAPAPGASAALGAPAAGAARAQEPVSGQEDRVVPQERPSDERAPEERTPEERAPRAPQAPAQARKPRASTRPVEQAIVAALEHGSHTLAELGVVTAMPAPALREGLRRLLAAGKIARTSREGRAAYALA
jgi:hypothetical protein